LADPPEIGISKISEDVKKKVIGGFFGNCLRMQKPLIKFKKVFSLGYGSWVWARIAQTFPITPKQAISGLSAGESYKLTVL
jgi:hypothetical protein